MWDRSAVSAEIRGAEGRQEQVLDELGREPAPAGPVKALLDTGRTAGRWEYE